MRKRAHQCEFMLEKIHNIYKPDLCIFYYNHIMCHIFEKYVKLNSITPDSGTVTHPSLVYCWTSV